MWASAGPRQLHEWFHSWLLESFSCAGEGRGSVQAWFSIALDIEEVLSGAADCLFF